MRGGKWWSMRWRLLVGLVLFALSAAGARAAELRLARDDRVLVLAPHPDDEALACGGLVQRALKMRLPVRIVFLTYGDSNEWSFAVYRKHPVVVPRAVRAMGLVRHDEAVAADRILGLGPGELTFLGYPDFGTFEIRTEHWGEKPPLRSKLTRVTAVPYASAFRPGAPYKGEEILRDLSTLLRDFRPTKVFVSHPADHNPDHRALYLFTRVALWDLEVELAPALFPYLVHYGGWPAPRGLRAAEALTPPLLAPPATWSSLEVPPSARARKRAALQAHATQYRYSADYLLSFVRANELFGDFPVLAPGAPPEPAGTVRSDPPEELTPAERAAFVGVEWRAVRLEGDALVVSTVLSRPLAEAVEASFYLFGYRRDRSFGRMPKLRVEVGMLGHRVLDQDRHLDGDTVEVVREARAIAVRVPLAALGRPERAFVSARTSVAEVPLDWTSWRVLELPAPR